MRLGNLTSASSVASRVAIDLSDGKRKKLALPVSQMIIATCKRLDCENGQMRIFWDSAETRMPGDEGYVPFVQGYS